MRMEPNKWNKGATEVFGSESPPSQQLNKYEHDDNFGESSLGLNFKELEELRKIHDENKINHGNKLTNGDDEACTCSCTIM